METIEHLVPVIKGEKSTEGVIYLYIFKMLPYSTCDKQVTHMIHIEGSKSTRFLYALMEYFSVYTYIVILHDDYEGENINMTYTYDVISNKEVNRKFSCPLKKGDIDTLKSIPHDQYCKEYLPEYRKRIDSIMEIWQERCSTYELQKLLKIVFSKYQENCLIDEQMLKQIKDVIMDFVIQKIDDTNADCNEHKR